MLLVPLLAGCLFDSYNAKYEDEFDVYCTDMGKTVYLDGQRFTSITDAINQAADGETVEVCPGTYTENLLIDTNIRVVGRQNSGRVIIQGDGSDAVILATDGVTLERMTIEGGGGFDAGGQTAGGGVMMLGGGTLDMKNVVLRGNYADLGGGIYAEGPALLENVTFNQNDAAQIGGGAIFVDDSTLNNVEFRENRAEIGGGFAVGFGVVDMSGGALDSNEADSGTALGLFEGAEAYGDSVKVALAAGDAVLLRLSSGDMTVAAIGSRFSCSAQGSPGCN